jgi:hypothetical protein
MSVQKPLIKPAVKAVPVAGSAVNVTTTNITTNEPTRDKRASDISSSPQENAGVQITCTDDNVETKVSDVTSESAEERSKDKDSKIAEESREDVAADAVSEGNRIFAVQHIPHEGMAVENVSEARAVLVTEAASLEGSLSAQGEDCEASLTSDKQGGTRLSVKAAAAAYQETMNATVKKAPSQISEITGNDAQSGADSIVVRERFAE